jgi:CRP/FNR family transcriptional regulator, anaerobic regulatory protein
MTNQFIQYLQLFRNIPQADIESITNAMQCRNVSEGEVLLEEGKIAKEIFFICKGVLRIVTVNDKGVPVTYFFLKENQFCTILNSFNNNIPAAEGIQAGCDTALLVLSKKSLLILYKQIPYLQQLITSIMQQALLDKIQIRNAYFHEDAGTRYQHFLMRQPDIALRVSLRDIASYLGITQQSLSRIRRNTR